MRRFFSHLFLWAGCLLLVGAALLAVYNLWDSDRAENEAKTISDALSAEMTPDLYGTGQDANGDGYDDVTGYLVQDWNTYGAKLWEVYPQMSMPTVEVDGYRYIGILEIPDFGMTLPVMEEWDYARLKKSPCRYSGSVYTDDMTIAGHNYSRLFGRLKKVKGGETVYFTDMAGNRFEYIISSVEVLDPTAVERMTEKDENSVWDMTLFTCTTGGQSRYGIRLERLNK